MLKFAGPDSLLFGFQSKYNVLREKHLAIKNDQITCGTPFSTVMRLEGLWAPPYVSSNSVFDMRVFGELVNTSSFRWFPFALEREGSVNDIRVESVFTFIPDARTTLIAVSLTNLSGRDLLVPLQVQLEGSLEYLHHWQFSPAENPMGRGADTQVEKRRIIKINNDKALIASASEKFEWFPLMEFWERKETIPAGKSVELYFTLSMGPVGEAFKGSERMMADPQKALADAVDWYEKEVKALLSNLPRFESDNEDLDNFYYRSVMHYLTNRWKQNDLVLNPYYSTGGMRGGCVGAYLWDFSAGWELHFLADPQGIKRQMLYFLGLDLTRCFAFSPVDGAAFGPWYPVNEEKIIGLIYYYVTITGDVAFLSEKAGGKTVLDHAVFHALVKDDLSKPLELTDYGIDGESHLELRRGIPYHGVIPDLNGRRYLNYIRAYELTKIAGCPNPVLLDRAEALKKLLKERLWNPEEKWFDFIVAGKRDIRYTVQMFKLFGSPVLDKEEEEGLLSHLSGEEFLSDFGIHSLSKLDPAYDKKDIDNGGPGACSIFGPLISEKLYRAGRGSWADSIMKRILWWGRRFPYWGDSFPANYVDYRQDTPLQCTHGGVAGAQCVIFGMFGIEVSAEGGITIKPYLPEFCGEMHLRNLKLHGKAIAIEVKADTYTVSMEGREWKSELGKSLVV